MGLIRGWRGILRNLTATKQIITTVLQQVIGRFEEIERVANGPLYLEFKTLRELLVQQ
jgi:hypothetical protein